MKQELTYIDLFCGAGGLSKGFTNENFTNLFAIEFNPAFAQTYQKNFPNHNIIIDDIRNITNEQIKELIQDKKVDIVIGGPPCQGFSKAGNIGRSFIDDERNFLFKEFVRVVSIAKPQYFLMENVAAVATHNKGKTLEEILKTFKSIGYECKWSVVDAVNYGVPQHRRRIIIVGSSNTNNFIYPTINDKYITIKDTIDDLPILASGENSNIPNHNAMKHSEDMLYKMSFIKDGGDRKDIPEDIRPKSGDLRKYIRYNSLEPSICITGDMRKVFHYNQNRALTCRELARIQTFPDDFIFYGTSSQIQQQIGNAVPVKLAQAFAKQFKEIL
jgi:DNA (cytosine-5)-methyltransferase 1